MKDASMSLGIYFEIKDAELYGGEGTTGYAATIVEISIEDCRMLTLRNTQTASWRQWPAWPRFRRKRCESYPKTNMRKTPRKNRRQL